MRLEKIKLTGFKSFVDPTTLHLPSNLVAVVGPNGCGKSNVIDAVRWVMGEGSARVLRGESMADVIFNGSGNRNPVAQAVVELFFDNSDSGIGGQYANVAEIAVKRAVSRDGVSNYFLNNTRCRRRDITELFLGTGLGPRSYSIIEQGMISRLIEAHPDDLRAFVEEAAGIAKYKERKRETETHIKNTRENLARLSDVRDEVAKRLNSLHRQAAAAEQYQALQSEEQRRRGELLALRWRSLEQKHAGQAELIAQAEAGVEATQVEHNRLNLSLEEQREQHYAVGERFKTIQESYYAAGTEVARVEQTLKYQHENHTRIQKELIQILQERTDLELKLQHNATQLAAAATILATQQDELTRLNLLQEQKDLSLDQAETSMRLWQEAWDEFQLVAAEPSQLAQQERLKLNHLEQQIQELNRRQDKLNAELKRLDIAELNLTIVDLESKQHYYNQQSTETKIRLDTIVADIQNLRQTQTEQVRKRDTAQATLQTILSCRATLESLSTTMQVDVTAAVERHNIAIAELEQQLHQFTVALDHNQQLLEKLEQDRSTEQDLLEHFNKNLQRTRNDLNISSTQLAQQTERHHHVTVELAEIIAQITQHQATISVVQEQLYTYLEAAEVRAVQRDEFTTQRNQLRQILDQAKTDAKTVGEQHRQMAATLETARLNRASLISANEQLQFQLTQHHQRATELTELLEQTASPLEDLTAELDALLDQHLRTEEELHRVKAQLEMAEGMVRTKERALTNLEHRARQQREILEKTRLAGQELLIQIRAIEEQFKDSGLNLLELLASMPDTATPAVWEAELARCSSQLQHLGPVNLAAIAELQEEQQRKTQLDAQHEDVSHALDTLEEAIRKIDRETKARFKETFDKINAELHNLFPRLFGGGQAYLELTENDLLNAGVTVMARPPGKRNSNIHLLSGGEKALTAVALVFAIFQLNPAPFCMLDEVDAPLDDTNVGRFCDLVRSLATQVQFIFITHNKVTMELANQLIGVTMHEPGVSRFVMVDVDEAVKLAAN